jgi:hypothetical protein
VITDHAVDQFKLRMGMEGSWDDAKTFLTILVNDALRMKQRTRKGQLLWYSESSVAICYLVTKPEAEQQIVVTVLSEAEMRQEVDADDAILTEWLEEKKEELEARAEAGRRFLYATPSPVPSKRGLRSEAHQALMKESASKRVAKTQRHAERMTQESNKARTCLRLVLRYLRDRDFSGRPPGADEVWEKIREVEPAFLTSAFLDFQKEP